MKTSFLAVDLGATSGRTVLATFDGQRIEMREFTRFENPQLPLGGQISLISTTRLSVLFGR